MKEKIAAAKRALNEAKQRMHTAGQAIEDAGDGADLEALERAFNDAVAEVERSKESLERLENVERARAANPVVETDDPDDSAQRVAPRVEVTREELTYRPDGDHSFFRDLARASCVGDFEAAQRLHRHNKETADYRSRESEAAEKEARKRGEFRDVTTSDPGAGGFVPPVYLADMWVGLPRGGRAFADRCRSVPLPADGLTLTIPKVQSGTSVDVQNGEGTAVAEVDADSQTVTAPVRTVAGQQDLSIQAVERTSPGFDRIVMEDLVRAYDERLDIQLLRGSGAAGQHQGISGLAGINSVSYTDASPTAAELLPKLFDGIQRIESAKVGEATDIFWHPRRSAWMASNLSSTFPLFQLGNLTQAIGTQSGGMANNVTGVNATRDVNIATDLGVGTNEDEIYIANMLQVFLAEGELRSRALAEVLSGTLQVRFQVYAYSAFIPNRLPAAISKISGTGLVAPAF